MHYLISFPSSAMSHISDEELPSVSESSRAVIREAKAAGVYVFGGGIDETVPPVMVTGAGKLSAGTYPETSKLSGGFCVLKVQSREEAEVWASKLAAGCRCAQELRQFMFDPESLARAESRCQKRSEKCGLTPRSSGAPTAAHQGPA
jgi:hypothetical protein